MFSVCNYSEDSTHDMIWGNFLKHLRTAALQETSGGLLKFSFEIDISDLKVGHSPIKKVDFICFNGRPLKIMTNASYFILTALFVLTIFTYLVPTL